MTAFDAVWHAVATQRYRHPEDGPQAVRSRFVTGRVRLRDGRSPAEDEWLRPGTDLWFYRIPAPEPDLPDTLHMVYSDDAITVVNKPPFMAMTPRGRHITNSLVVQLRRMTGNDHIVPAHRLDRATSGLVLCTNARELRGAYQKLFENRTVAKTYTAIAPWSPRLANAPAADDGPGAAAPILWESRIEKRVGDPQAHEVSGPVNAQTRLLGMTKLTDSETKALARRYGTQSPLARYWLRPITGKTHQLRVHMASAGIPILGDRLYPHADPQFDHDDYRRPLGLCAVELTFHDPITHTTRTFHTPAHQ